MTMRYILVKAQVLMGTPNNTLSLLVLTRTGWIPWSEVEGKTNCNDPDLCPVVSVSDWEGAHQTLAGIGPQGDGAIVVPVDVDNPVYIKGGEL